MKMQKKGQVPEKFLKLTIKVSGEHIELTMSD